MGTRGSSEAVREGFEGAGTAGSIGVGSGEGADWSSGAASSWGGWGSTDSPFCWARIHSETWKGGFSGGGAGLFGAETARRCGIRPSMAMIMARAFLVSRVVTSVFRDNCGEVESFKTYLRG